MEPLPDRASMTVADYLTSLEETLFTGAYHRFWLETVLELMDILGPDTDPGLERLTATMRASVRAVGAVDALPEISREIVRLRGPGFWRDTSPLGLKYRCLNAIAARREHGGQDSYNRQYGVVTALQLLSRDGRNDQTLIRHLKAALSTLRSCS